jgi:hypothetical protein
MLNQSSVRIKRRTRLGLALVLVTAGGAAAVWNQTRIKFSTAPRVRIAGRVSTHVVRKAVFPRKLGPDPGDRHALRFPRQA